MSATITEDRRIHINLQTQQKFSYLEDKKTTTKTNISARDTKYCANTKYIFSLPLHSIEIRNTSLPFSEMDLKAEDGMEVG